MRGPMYLSCVGRVPTCYGQPIIVQHKTSPVLAEVAAMIKDFAPKVCRKRKVREMHKNEEKVTNSDMAEKTAIPCK